MSRNYAEIIGNIRNGIKSYIWDRYDLDTHDYVYVEDVYIDIIIAISVGIGTFMILYAIHTYISLVLGFTVTTFAKANMLLTGAFSTVLLILSIIKTLVDIEMGECDWWDKLMRCKIRIGNK